MDKAAYIQTKGGRTGFDSTRISAIYDSVVRLIKDSVDKALAAFQLDIDVKVNPVVNFRI